MSLISASRQDWDSLEPTVIEWGVDFGAVSVNEKLEETAETPVGTSSLISPSMNYRPGTPVKLVDERADLSRTAINTDLLRSRLQTASIISIICLTALFVRTLFCDDLLVQLLRSVCPIIAVGCLGILLAPTALSARQLRRIERMLFGSLCASVIILQYFFLVQAARTGDAPQAVAVAYSGTLGLAVMMLAYGMLMPNGWRRTAVMMVPPFVTPIAMLILLRWQYASVAEVINTVRLLEIGLGLFLSGLVATYGTFTVSRLRSAANRAMRFGQYRLKRALGQGGMGQVFLAEHQLLKRPCAIKVIQPGQGANPEALKRFEHEVRCTARLSHWNTIEIFDYGHTDDGTFYYVMEYMRGLSLSELVKRYGPLPPGRAIHFLTQTCWALQEAHNHGLIHRDLKPANIYAAKRGGVYDVTKLFDFGLVLQHKGMSGRSTLQGTDFTSPFAGSPLYMSPEQVAGAKLDARTDIYSLGAVSYFLLTGRPPFHESTPWKVMQAHAHEPVEPPTRWNPNISRELEQVILRCLSKKPEERYGSPRELAEALFACRGTSAWDYEQAAVWWKSRAIEIDPELLMP